MKQLLACLSFIILLVSCSGGHKKIVVLTKGKADINQDAKTIKVTDGSGHEETTIQYHSNGSVDLNVSSKAGTTTVNIPGDGYYVLNAKSDTIIGAYVNYGAPELTQHKFTQEEVKLKIDSLQQLVENKNISAANKNFYILPNHAAKVTDNTDAIVVTPFHQMRAIEVKGDTKPEVYRFYSIKEIRETIEKLKELTGESKEN
jgi:hypothetical protein